MRSAKLRKLWLVLLVAASGCSPAVIRIAPAEISRLQSENKIPVVTHAPQPFSFISAEDKFRTALAAGALGALTGGLGGVLVGMHAESRARAQGQELARASALADPALKVRDTFVAAVIGQFNMTNLIPVEESFATDAPEAMREKLEAAIVLDFKTTEWRLIPAGTDEHYRVLYRVRSRFVRTSDDTILWQGYCRFDGSSADATLAELQAGSGALLGTKMDEAAESCATTLLVQFLGQD